MRGSYHITIAALALLFACTDEPSLVDKGREAVKEDRRDRAERPRPPPDPHVATPPISRPRVEGAASPALVFTRAQQAISAGDHVALLQSIRPTTRARWLRDLVVAMAVVSTDDGTDHDEKSTRAKKQIRDLLTRYGAYGAVQGADLSAEGVGRALVEKVQDPDGLFAALLDFALERGAPFDPVRALERLRRGARVSERPDPTATSLLRLVDRVRAPHEIGPVDADAGDQAMTRIPDAGGADGAFLPVRFHTEGPITWLDES